MKTQLINYSELNPFKFNVDKVSRFENLISPSNYNINIFDLRDISIWRNNNENYSAINLARDFRIIKSLVQDSINSHHLFILPRDVAFNYGYFQKSYRKEIHLRHMITELNNIIYNIIPIKIVLEYERTMYKVNDEIITADFKIIDTVKKGIHFDRIEYDEKIKSDKSNRTIGVKKENISVISIDVNNQLQLNKIFEELLITEKIDIKNPEWFKNIKFLNDEVLFQSKRKHELEIEDISDQIKKITKEINLNDGYKSILYLDGDALVDKTINILEILFEQEFEEFKDIKKEDFLFKLNDKYFIFEIKGVSSNVKTTHLSQLDHHSMEFLDENEIAEDDINKILIINYQKNKNPIEREPIHINQINDAKHKYNILIVDTFSLLKILEGKKSNKINKEDIIKIFSKNGLIEGYK